MNLQTTSTDSAAIVYDADVLPQPGPDLFDPDHWRRQGAVTATALGRGNALMIAAPFGPAVLRQYLRGGWAARVSRDRYVFTSFDRSRPIREFHALARLRAAGLPVPQPIAACCERGGLSYTGALITRRIERAETLAEALPAMPPDDARWPRVGVVVRRFHQAGVDHADLNARNILLDGNEGIFLVDFDRATLKNRSLAGLTSNLSRLKRSLVKLWPHSVPWTLDACWTRLMTAYSHGA